jgi:hypothetical protein
MLSRKSLILLVGVAFVPVLVVACASKGDFEGGGRSLEPGVIPSTTSTEDSGPLPEAAPDISTTPDVSSQPETGPKDGGQG